MRLVFTFAESAELKTVSKYDIYTSQLEVPDEALHLIGLPERVLAIGELIGYFTQAFLFMTCKELGIRNQLIKLPSDTTSLRFTIKIIALHFERYNAKPRKRVFKILFPITAPLPELYLKPRGNSKERKSLAKNLTKLGAFWCKSDEDKEYADKMQHLAEQLLVLLNAQPARSPNSHWRCSGFHGNWSDDTLVNLFNRRRRQQETEQRKIE